MAVLTSHAEPGPHLHIVEALSAQIDIQMSKGVFEHTFQLL